MGRQAKLTQQRRQARRELAAFTRAEHDQRASDPRVQAALERVDADTEARNIMLADLDGQVSRLMTAGWRPREEGSDGLGVWDHRRGVRLIHSVCREPDDQVWAHMSLSHRDDTLPGWYELRDAHRLLYPHRPGLIVIPAESEHFSVAEIHHVWTCLTAEPLPDFRFLGAI